MRMNRNTKRLLRRNEDALVRIDVFIRRVGGGGILRPVESASLGDGPKCRRLQPDRGPVVAPARTKG